MVFHVTSLPAPTRDGLLEICAVDGLPNTTYYGDGQPIPDEVTDHLRH
ncbi:hypothetical protein ACFXAZ_15985 [Streptomyces sp. NPDC059477]